jgi:hypothetical protein
MKKSQRWRRKPASGVAAAPRRAGAEVGDAARVSESVPAARFSLNWRGIALDLAVVASNLFLLAPLARVLRAGGQGFLAQGRGAGWKVSSDVGWLFLSVFAAYTVGAYLKLTARQSVPSESGAFVKTFGADASNARAPAASARTRRRRLGEFSSGAYRPSNKILVFVVCALLLFHFFIFLMLLVSGWQSTWLESWSPLFGSKPADNTYLAFFVRFVLFIFILPLPTALTAFSLGGGADAPDSTWRTRPLRGLLADLLLYFSVVVLTLVLNVLIAPRFVNVEGAAGWTLGNVLASLIPLALAFSIFYLPPRLIYLAEDYTSPVTWLTILLALMSLAYRTFFPGDLQW